MRVLSCFLICCVFAMLMGCSDDKGGFDGPIVDKFLGKVVQNGEPVSFDDGDEYRLSLFHEKGESFNIPLAKDGTFTIGWMPIGKYSVAVVKKTTTTGGKQGSAPFRYGVPDGLDIQEGKTDYSIELGPKFKK